MAARAPIACASYALLCHDFPAFLQRLTTFLRFTPTPALHAHLLRTEDVRQRAALHGDSLARSQHAAPLPGRFRRELSAPVRDRINALTRPLRLWMQAREPVALRSLYDD